MTGRQKRFTGITAVLAALAVAAALVARRFPAAVSRLYTRRGFRYITAPLRAVVALCPFSVAEILLLLGLLACIFFLGRSIGRAVCTRRLRPLARYAAGLFSALCLCIVCFVLLGGLNYSGLTFAETAGYELIGSTEDELAALCLDLGREAAAARMLLPQNSDGVTDPDVNLYELLRQAQAGYDALADRFPALAGTYPVPKPAFLSRAMSYLQISGIYPYLMPEAIVNADTPVMSLPHTICHEMAHQRGFAREDEANYIAYLTAVHNPDPLFRYSGYLEAFTYSMNALYAQNPSRWAAVAARVHSGLYRDIAYIDAFWEAYRTPGDVVENISTSVNDAYLHINDVDDGIRSYGRMVDLLLAERRARLAASTESAASARAAAPTEPERSTAPASLPPAASTDSPSPAVPSPWAFVKSSP